MSNTYLPYETKEEIQYAKELKSKFVPIYKTSASLMRVSNGKATVLGNGSCSNAINRAGNFYTLDALKADNGALLQLELDSAARLCTKCYQINMLGLPITLDEGEACYLKRQPL